MPSSIIKSLFIGRPMALIVVALFGLITVAHSDLTGQIMAATSASHSPGVYQSDYPTAYKKPARNSIYQNNQINMQQHVAVPTMEQPVAVPQIPAASAAQVDNLIKQVQALNLPRAATKDSLNINNHVSKVSIGNQKETNINNINNSVAPITQKSMTSQDVGPKGSVVGNQNQLSSITGKAKTHPTEEQKELKARLLELASKATANAPNEPVLRYNQRTGVLERIPVDPNASLYKDKLQEALEVLNPKKLPTNKLKAVLDGPSMTPINPYGQVIINNGHMPNMELAPEPQAEPEPVAELELEPEAEEEVPELAPLEEVPSREDVVNQIRFELDDRLNRISDLLYFRPEFMNQLLEIDDPVELTPVESEFKRMILCNSDEQFCSQDLANWAGNAAIPIEASEEDFVDEATAAEAEASNVAQRSWSARRSHGYLESGSIERARSAHPVQPRSSGVHRVAAQRVPPSNLSNNMRTRDPYRQRPAGRPSSLVPQVRGSSPVAVQPQQLPSQQPRPVQARRPHVQPQQPARSYLPRH